MFAVLNLTFIQITDFSAPINQCAVTGKHIYILHLVSFLSQSSIILLLTFNTSVSHRTMLNLVNNQEEINTEIPLGSDSGFLSFWQNKSGLKSA